MSEQDTTFTATITWEGVELPAQFQGRNGLWQWKEEPEDRVVDEMPELATHAEAVNRQREMFLEEGIYRNNYFFLKFSLRREWRKVSQEVREKTPIPPDAGREGKRKALKERRKMLREARAPFALAMNENRNRWYDYKEEYAREMEETSEELERLWHKERAEEEAREAAARAKREAEQKRRAEEEARKRAADPGYDAHVRKGEENRRRSKAENEQRMRDHIACLQQMSDEEFDALMEEERKLLRTQGHSKDIVDQYIEQEKKEHKRRMMEWKASGKPLGQW